MIIDLSYTDEQIREVISAQNFNLKMKPGKFGIHIPSCGNDENVSNAILFINYSPLYISVNPLYDFVSNAMIKDVYSLCVRIETIANRLLKENY